MGIRVSCSFFAPYTVLLFYFTLRLLPHQFLGIQASTVASNETDRLALLQFKSKITYDPLGALGSWNASIHFCNWYGVTCSRRHQQRVTILDLGSLKLAVEYGPHSSRYVENGPKCLKRKMEKEMFEEENEEHGFDFLGHHFAINRSANEELIHSIQRAI